MAEPSTQTMHQKVYEQIMGRVHQDLFEFHEPSILKSYPTWKNQYAELSQSDKQCEKVMNIFEKSIQLRGKRNTQQENELLKKIVVEFRTYKADYLNATEGYKKNFLELVNSIGLSTYLEFLDSYLGPVEKKEIIEISKEEQVEAFSLETVVGNQLLKDRIKIAKEAELLVYIFVDIGDKRYEDGPTVIRNYYEEHLKKNFVVYCYHIQSKKITKLCKGLEIDNPLFKLNIECADPGLEKQARGCREYELGQLYLAKNDLNKALYRFQRSIRLDYYKGAAAIAELHAEGKHPNPDYPKDNCQMQLGMARSYYETAIQAAKLWIRDFSDTSEEVNIDIQSYEESIQKL